MLARDAVCDALERHLKPQARSSTCFVGFSGGLDSTVLLHALTFHGLVGLSESSGPIPPFKIQALHANHGLHGDAELWEARCRDQCRSWGVAFVAATLEVKEAGSGLEAAAREARYHWFEQQLDPGDCLLLAHHQDDQAETLLLRLLRGAGPEGLAAMPEQRDLGAGLLRRPLLLLPRGLLLDYAQEAGLHWITDPSNADLRFDRNFLRSEIMPRLEKRWPGYRKTLTRTAQQMRDIAPLLSQHTLPLSFSTAGDPGFPLDALPSDNLQAARALRRWLRDRGLTMPPAARLQEFVRQLLAGNGAQMATPEWVVQRFRDAVYVYPGRRPLRAERQAIRADETVLDPAMGRVRLRAESEPLGDSLASTLVGTPVGTPVGTLADHLGEGCTLMLAFREGGERLNDQDGHHRDLKALFQRHAVPPWWRDRVPLLMLCQADSCEMIAVGPYARSALAVALGVELDWQPPTLAVK